jgi:hypothetical protein
MGKPDVSETRNTIEYPLCAVGAFITKLGIPVRSRRFHYEILKGETRWMWKYIYIYIHKSKCKGIEYAKHFYGEKCMLF